MLHQHERSCINMSAPASPPSSCPPHRARQLMLHTGTGTGYASASAQCLCDRIGSVCCNGLGSVSHTPSVTPYVERLRKRILAHAHTLHTLPTRLCDPIRSIKHMLYAYAACCMERMQPRGSSSSCSPEASSAHEWLLQPRCQHTTSYRHAPTYSLWCPGDLECVDCVGDLSVDEGNDGVAGQALGDACDPCCSHTPTQLPSTTLQPTPSTLLPAVAPHCPPCGVPSRRLP